MNQLIQSRHAEQRMRQRGMRTSDLDLILRCGTMMGGDIDDIYFLKDKDARREIDARRGRIRCLTQARPPLRGRAADHAHEVRGLKREINAFERLRGRKVVVAEGTIVTCCHSSRRDQKRMFRNGRRCPARHRR